MDHRDGDGNHRCLPNEHCSTDGLTEAAVAAAATTIPTTTPSVASTTHSESTSATDDGVVAKDCVVDVNVNVNVLETEIDMDDLTQQMGQLWWPTSNQDLSKIYRRDKYGRLVTRASSPKGGDKGISNGISNGDSDSHGSASDGSDTGMSFNNNGGGGEGHVPLGPAADDDAEAAASSSTEWYDKWIASAQSATLNLIGHFRTGRRRHGARRPSDVSRGRDGDDDDDESFEKMDSKLRTSMALADYMDKHWAKEMYEMDPGEREDILNEIHGIPNRRTNRTLRETPESVAAAVAAFRKHLGDTLGDELDNGDSIVPPVTKDAYRRAVFDLNSGYVLSRDFLLKFLRISNYDTASATLRYFRYLDLLDVLFGDTALTRPLALRDLTKREIRYLKKGQMQLLPSRDLAGRRIYAFSGRDDPSFNIREKYRCNVYLYDVQSDDEQTQKLGAVALCAPRVRPHDANHPFGFEGMTLRLGKQELLGGECTETQFFRKTMEGVPIRLSAIHYFAPQTIIYNIGKGIILSLLGKDYRKIVRFHAGSQLECNYSLRSFGIPHEDITITEGDNIKTKHVQRFLNARRTIEAHRERCERAARWADSGGSHWPGKFHENERCPGIECPGVDCVVFGVKTMHGLPANVEFRELLRVSEREREERLSRGYGEPGTAAEGDAVVVPSIKEFIEGIIATARSKHRLRFLVFDKTSHLFVDIEDHQELCKRISQALRDQRKRFRIEEQRSQMLLSAATHGSGSGKTAGVLTSSMSSSSSSNPAAGSGRGGSDPPIGGWMSPSSSSSQNAGGVGESSVLGLDAAKLTRFGGSRGSGILVGGGGTVRGRNGRGDGGGCTDSAPAFSGCFL